MIRPKLTRTEAILLPIITPAQHSIYEYFKISDYNTHSLIFNVVAIIFIVMFVSFLYYKRRKNSKNKNT